MRTFCEHILPPIDGIRCNQESDGGFTVTHGPATITFSPLEMAQIARGLVSTEAVRALIMGVLGITEELEKTLGAQRQRMRFRQSQHISLN